MSISSQRRPSLMRLPIPGESWQVTKVSMISQRIPMTSKTMQSRWHATENAKTQCRIGCDRLGHPTLCATTVLPGYPRDAHVPISVKACRRCSSRWRKMSKKRSLRQNLSLIRLHSSPLIALICDSRSFETTGFSSSMLIT